VFIAYSRWDTNERIRAKCAAPACPFAINAPRKICGITRIVFYRNSARIACPSVPSVPATPTAQSEPIGPQHSSLIAGRESRNRYEMSWGDSAEYYYLNNSRVSGADAAFFPRSGAPGGIPRPINGHPEGFSMRKRETREERQGRRSCFDTLWHRVFQRCGKLFSSLFLSLSSSPPVTRYYSRFLLKFLQRFCPYLRPCDSLYKV
jgi:hypothetical protein